MSLKESRKLKRGLRDISQLFRSKSERAPAKSEPSLPRASKIVSVISPNNPGDSLFLNTFLASQVEPFQYQCLIVSISLDESRVSDFSTATERTVISWNQFLSYCHKGISENMSHEQNAALVFIDFEYTHVPEMEKVINLVDKLVILLRPTFESFKEAYKAIKATYYFNREIEYYVIFEGASDDPRGTVILEKLSEMASQYLGVQLIWLGSIHFSEGTRRLKSTLAMEHLFIDSMRKMNPPEKICFLNSLQKRTDSPLALLS